MEFELFAEHFKALSDKTRLRILSLLRVRELCVYQLVDILHMTQPSISQHLRKLKNVGFVKEQRRGQWVFYSLEASHVPYVQAILQALPGMDEELNTYWCQDAFGNCCT